MIKHLLILALLATTIIGCNPTPQAERTPTAKGGAQFERPNFVFIAIDDLNDWVGYMGGHPQANTPNMDALASEGVAFTNAHSVAPGCSPSRNALLYGVEPFNSGLYAFYKHDIYKKLRQKYISLPKLLKANGYKTYGAGKIHHGPEYGNGEWTEYFNAVRFSNIFVKDKGFKISLKESFRATSSPLEQMSDHQSTTYGIDVIKQKHAKPFFAAIGLVKPHLPFDCPVEFYDALPEVIQPPAILANDLDDIGREGNSMRRARDDRKYKQGNRWHDVRKAYLACVSWVDYNVGRIIDAIKTSPNAENTVVVLWSDQGFHLGEKQTFKKFTLWEEASRVPFIIHDLREEKRLGRKVTQGVTLINVYRTIAELAGIEVPEYVDGFSLVPLLADTSAPVEKPAISSWGRGNYSVRTRDWRLIQYFDGSQELYHHVKDINEWHNLAKDPKYQDKLIELSAMLPQNEAPIIEEYIELWSLFGADKARLKKALKANKSIKEAKKQAKQR